MFLQIKTIFPIKPSASRHREDAATLLLPPSKITMCTFVFNGQKDGYMPTAIRAIRALHILPRNTNNSFRAAQLKCTPPVQKSHRCHIQ